MQTQQEELQIGEWQMIPKNAFLFFPIGQAIKIGEGQKAWRKIFQNGQPYDNFEEQNLILLQNKLAQKRIKPHPWFSKANKLRFLQANKFKLDDTCKSIKEGSIWRENDFPIKVTNKIEQLLNSGCFYFCGRDNEYRPILISDIQKFKEDDIDHIPTVLMILIEFMLKELLIPGQVQNYVLILNLQAASFGMRNTIMKIVSFTSNTYRGRLFASYLLGMPGALKFGWDSLASKFVSENTLKKIKIAKKLEHPDLWTHTDQAIIEEKYGGKMKNLSAPFWPPSPELMKFQSKKVKNKLITEEEYEKRYNNKKIGKKIQKRLLKKTKSVENINKSIIRSEKDLKNSQGQMRNEKDRSMTSSTLLKLKNIRQFTNLPQKFVKKENEINLRRRKFQLFFQTAAYEQISS